MRSYLGITGHYISHEWEIEHVMLGCNRVFGRHTAENIMVWYDEVTTDFGIREKVQHIVTDSGSKALRMIKVTAKMMRKRKIMKL